MEAWILECSRSSISRLVIPERGRTAAVEEHVLEVRHVLALVEAPENVKIGSPGDKHSCKFKGKEMATKFSQETSQLDAVQFQTAGAAEGTNSTEHLYLKNWTL